MKMLRRSAMILLACALLPVTAAAQDKEILTVRIRAVLHDPINPVAELYHMDKEGSVKQVMFRPHDFGRPVDMAVVNGSLVMFGTDLVDPRNLAASIVASEKLPEQLKQAIAVVLPGSPEDKLPYRLFIIDDSESAFPYGESLVLPLVKVKMAVQAGEHEVPIRPGKISRIPAVTKVNAFNMAQTNFHYHHNGSWVTFAERQLQYLDASRRLFIIYATPGALQPTVMTLMDVRRRG